MNAASDPAGNGSRDTEHRSQPVPDPVIHRLHALLEEQLPNSAHRARLHLLERLLVLEEEAITTGADPETLLSIRTIQRLLQTSDPLIGA